MGSRRHYHSPRPRLRRYLLHCLPRLQARRHRRRRLQTSQPRYKHPNQDGPNLAITNDGGKTWDLSTLHPQAYFSAVAYDRKVIQDARQQRHIGLRAELKGEKISAKPIPDDRLFIVGQDFIFDFRPPNNPRRINAKKKLGMKFNAASAFPEGGALIVGPKGAIVLVP